jgi:Carboxypeptidase regulatory-like domain
MKRKNVFAWLLLIICASICASAQQKLPTGTFRVSGRVVDEQTHSPVPGAKVALLISQSGLEQRRVADVAADGSFVFTGLSAGKYDLYAEAKGYRQQALNAHENFLTGVAVGVGKNTEGIVFALAKETVLTGTVIDEAGDPVRDANVVLFRKSNLEGADEVRMSGVQNTDDRGTFDFRDLPAGTYYLAVSARPWYATNHFTTFQNGGATGTSENRDPALDVVYPVTFYGGATDEAEAQAITLKSGARFEANVTLFPTPGLHVRVRGTAGQNSTGLILHRKIFGQWDMPMAMQVTRGNGDWEMTGVAPGNYIARVIGNRPRSFRFDGSRQFPVEITGDTEIDPSQSGAPAEVSGLVQLQGNPTKESNHMILFRGTGDDSRAIARLETDGHFRGVEISPGKYRVALMGRGGYSVQSLATSGAAHVVGHEIEFSSGPATVAILATNDRTEIDGTVTDHGKPLSGAMVLLVPREGVQEKERIHRDESDSDGTFTLRAVPAGSYTLLALRDGWEMEWSKPEVLAPYLKNGLAVEIAGKGNRQVKVEAQ